MTAKTSQAAAGPKAGQSILLISKSQAIRSDVGTALSAVPKSALEVRDATIVQMNGHAAEMAGGSDIVIFETGATDDGELHAIRALLAARRPDSLFVALTDGDLPFAKARLLTRAGVDEILPTSYIGEELPEILQRSLAHGAAPARAKPAEKRGAIIAVSQARGGIGATTVAVNLASLLLDRRGLVRKQAHHRVALVDLDLQFGNVGIFLDIEDRGALVQIATNDAAPDAAFLNSAMSVHKSGLAVLPAPAQPVPLDALGADRVAATLDVLRSEYDYVVVDMPRALVPWIAPLLGRADKLLLATEMSVPGVRHARRLIDFYTEDYPVLPIEIVVMRERRPMFLSQMHKEAAQVLERPLDHWLPLHRGATEAMDRGQPLVEFDSGCELSKAFRKLAKSVAATLQAQQTPHAS